MSPLPTDPSGRVDWKRMARQLKPGDVITLPKIMRFHAPNQLRRNGVLCKSTTRGVTLTITVMDAPAPKLLASGPFRTASAETREAKIPGRIREARDNAAYYKRQASLCTHQDARRRALASHAAWKMTAERLSQLETTTA